MSTFSGKIKEFPQISVDRFDGRNLASTAYFLSHAHSDHMIGLSSPQFLDHLESNSGVYLYTSPITDRFLQASIRHRPLSFYVRPLQLEEPIKVTVPNVAEEATHQLWVTLIPAAHCPGSVMFLFEGRGGTVLYTGDFRISVGDVSRIRHLHNQDGTVKIIDSLHIDTTFCHKDTMHFPSREESATAVGDLVEEWLTRSASTGITHLIHLVCPAKYGYEYIYRSLYERFGRPIHVSRWKYRMYDTVPEIQNVLTLETKDTWIHACDWRMKQNEAEEEEGPGIRQIPCMCPPHGVVGDPQVRVIKPSAMFYAFFQSEKEIKHYNTDGTFCRVLLSMHASCSEVLDMVSYLRPRKVFPNVIPINSTKEEVLKLLHEALNRSGDHYSIEYVSNNRGTIGPFKRQLHSSESSYSGNNSLLDVFLSSPHKRRRHSDSNMSLVLPPPRGNMKGSLSLEGEARQIDPLGPPLPLPRSGNNVSLISGASSSSDLKSNTSDASTVILCSDGRRTPEKIEEELEWKDPYTPSPVSKRASQSSTGGDDVSQSNKALSLCVERSSHIVDEDSVSYVEHTERPPLESSVSNASMKSVVRNYKSSVDTEGSMLDRSNSVVSMLTSSQDSLEGSVFSDDGEKGDVDVEASSCSIAYPESAKESIQKRNRRQWYKHKHFSTPIHEESEKSAHQMEGSLAVRASSLPLPENLGRRSDSSELNKTAGVDFSVPIITVSSPSDHNSDSQLSNESMQTVTPGTDVPLDLSEHSPLSFANVAAQKLANSSFNKSSNNNNDTSEITHSIRPSVIRTPQSKPESDPEGAPKFGRTDSIVHQKRSECTIGKWIDLSKKKAKAKRLAQLKKEKITLVDLTSLPVLPNTITITQTNQQRVNPLPDNRKDDSYNNNSEAQIILTKSNSEIVNRLRGNNTSALDVVLKDPIPHQSSFFSSKKAKDETSIEVFSLDQHTM